MWWIISWNIYTIAKTILKCPLCFSLLFISRPFSLFRRYISSTMNNYMSFVTSCKADELIPCSHQTQADRDLLLIDEDCIYPPGIEKFSTNGEFLPLPPRRRTELDQQFFGELWEPDINPYQGYKRDPFADLPLQARLRANIHKHRSDMCYDITRHLV